MPPAPREVAPTASDEKTRKKSHCRDVHIRCIMTIRRIQSGSETVAVRTVFYKLCIRFVIRSVVSLSGIHGQMSEVFVLELPAESGDSREKNKV